MIELGLIPFGMIWIWRPWDLGSSRAERVLLLLRFSRSP